MSSAHRRRRHRSHGGGCCSDENIERAVFPLSQVFTFPQIASRCMMIVGSWHEAGISAMPSFTCSHTTFPLPCACPHGNAAIALAAISLAFTARQREMHLRLEKELPRAVRNPRFTLAQPTAVVGAMAGSDTPILAQCPPASTTASYEIETPIADKDIFYTWALKGFSCSASSPRVQGSSLLSTSWQERLKYERCMPDVMATQPASVSHVQEHHSIP
jgi:hypothetical protein